MAFLQANEAGYIVKDYKYQRYPLVMHRGQYPNIESIHVKSEQEEKDAASKGFTLERPPVAEPVPERPTLSLEERLDELEERVAVLEERLAASQDQSIVDHDAEVEGEDEEESDSVNDEGQPKRKRGRPRKVIPSE